MRFFRVQLFLLILAAALLGQPAHSDRPPRIVDFTFVHCSDVHVPPGVTRRTGPAGGPQFGSADVIAQIKTLTGPIDLPPYRVTVPRPAFAIATGDLTEFGGLNGWWDQYLQLWQGAPFPVYQQSGNHDSTWACQRYRIRELHGGAYYSFDYNGCHFIGWDSATPQDPRPSFGEEGLRWLRKDLERVDPSTPIFLFCHHPLQSNEFASRYERDRLLDLLRPYNLTLLLVGHGHGVQHRVVDGVDQVMGGSTFGANPGYAIVSVKDDVLRVAYRRAWEPAPMQAVLERPLRRRSAYPQIQITAPEDGATLRGTSLRVRANIRGARVRAARWTLDDVDGQSGELAPARDGWEGSLDTADLAAGCHYLRVTFEGEPDAAGKTSTYQRTTRFYVEPDRSRVLWRAFLGGSGKGSPAVAGDLVVAGGGDGVLYAFDRRRGRLRWRFRTGGEILAQPLVTENGIYFGSGDCYFYALDRKGKLRWRFHVGHPVYSSAVSVAGKIVVAANNGHIYGLDSTGGFKQWECEAPAYAIKSRPFVRDGTVYYGSWDGYVYAVNAEDGSVRWKTQGAGSRASLPGVARYYSPADAGPIAAGGKLWIADRMYRLSILDADNGELREERKDVSSVALSAAGDAIYLRGTRGDLIKLDLEGKELWRAPARTSFLPSAPAEQDGVVYSMTATGRLIALDARDGQKLWEYQTTPGLYVFSDPVPADGAVYVTGMDGSLTALRTGRAPGETAKASQG
jgi:outer membrane protein assembly factor BamB